MSAMGNFFGGFGQLMGLLKDENFRKFLSNPKVQELMSDPEFKKAVQEQNMERLASDERFKALMQDPELRTALEGMSKKFKK